MQAGRPVTHRDIAYAFILDERQRILIVKNSGRNWSLPGGRRDPGESLRECVLREAVEEAGADILVGQLLYVSEAPYDGCFATFFIFHGQLRRLSEPTGKEDIDDVAWVDIDYASQLMRWYPPTLLRELSAAPGIPCVNEFEHNART